MFKVNNTTAGKSGVSLVELMVAVTIMSIIMLSLSTFFSGTLRNTFIAQQESEKLQEHITSNLIILDRFRQLSQLIEVGVDYALSYNQTTQNGQRSSGLPFSFVGGQSVNGSTHVVAHDLLLFSKIFQAQNGNYLYVNSGTGRIWNAGNNTPDPVPIPPAVNPNGLVMNNITSFTRALDASNNLYNYILHPHFNALLQCNLPGDNCSFVTTGIPLDTPIDITTNGNHKLFISDSGSGRVLEHDLQSNSTTVLIDNLNYPTGIVYYQTGTSEYLFVSETLAHQVKKFDLMNPVQDGSLLPIIVGDGKDKSCDANSTARLCALNLPTGLFINQAKDQLYIADSGNHRILRMRDPGQITNLTVQVSPQVHHPLSAVELINPGITGGTYNEVISNLIGFAQHYNNITKRFENSSTLTLYDDGNACTTGSNHFYVNTADISTTGLTVGSHIIIDGVHYTMSGNSTQDCDPGALTQNNKVRINVQENITATHNSGTSVDFSHPANGSPLVIQIDNVNVTQTGFHTTQVNLYDTNRLLVETLYHRARVGDGELGTPEDVIEVMAYNNPGLNNATVIAANGTSGTIPFPIVFPTGVSDAYFINSGNGNQSVVHYLSASSNPTSLLNAKLLPNFSYVSSSPVNNVQMDIYNANGFNNKLLEMTIDAPIGSRNIIHRLNAVLP